MLPQMVSMDESCLQQHVLMVDKSIPAILYLQKLMDMIAHKRLAVICLSLDIEALE